MKKTRQDRGRTKLNRLVLLSLVMALSLINASCQMKKSTQSTLWINSARVDCVGVAPMQCLQVKSGENEPWTLFYQNIAGFDFEPGCLYQLRVEIDSLPKDEVPADGSSLAYRLIEVVSKTRDPHLDLQDIWIANKIGETGLEGQNRPILEINIAKQSIMGNDGCNAYRSKIEKLEGAALEFGPIMSTKKACPDMQLANRFNAALALVKSFKKSGLELRFYDESGQELLAFTKAD